MTEQNREPDDATPRPPGPQLPPERPAQAAGRPERAPRGEGRSEPPERAQQPPERAPKPDEATPAPRETAPPEPAARESTPGEAAPPGSDAESARRDGTPDGDGYEPAAATGGPAASGRERLIAALWPPRVSRPQLIAAVLLFVLGLGLAIQVRSTSESSPLRGARQEDLVRILDELDDRTTRLQEEKQRLEAQRRELENSSDQAEEARRQTMQKKRQLGVLAGTVAAEGPGLRITVRDPAGAVEADMLLDTIQELRAAGAEAIQINDVRVVAGTYFTGSGGEVRVDGKKIDAPYRFLVIGEPEDLEPALNIPGGVVQTLEKEQAVVEVTRSEKITVDALRKPERPDYARSSQ